MFYFPLPQDASISGFGMWIGDELVEADVVEKQRAREIYETILRERRDPGLLEWSGGNIFKARVFPIAAQAEKRITITYTQVLPLRANGIATDTPCRARCCAASAAAVGDRREDQLGRAAAKASARRRTGHATR